MARSARSSAVRLAEFRPADAVAELLVEGTLAGEVLGAEIVQHVVEILFLVLMQPGGGGGGGGKGEGGIDEVFGKRGELLGGGFAAANGEQNKSKQGNRFRHCL